MELPGLLLMPHSARLSSQRGSPLQRSSFPAALHLQWREIQAWWQEGAVAWERQRRNEADSWQRCKAQQRAAWMQARQQRLLQDGAAQQRLQVRAAPQKRKQPCEGGEEVPEVASSTLARTGSSDMDAQPPRFACQESAAVSAGGWYTLPPRRAALQSRRAATAS